MSVTDLTTASAWIAGLAIVALVATGWRKPARAAADPPREPRRPSRRGPVAVTTAPTRLHRRTPIWRKLWAIVASGTLGVVMGAVLATVVAAGLGWTVITLTDMLRR